MSDYKGSIPTRFAAMGGAYGNVPALIACIADARRQDCDTLMFLGDATGCCGHSDETLALVRAHFPIRVAGNHEQQVAAGSDTCGCGYEDPEDERLGCLAHEYAISWCPQYQCFPCQSIPIAPDASLSGATYTHFWMRRCSPARWQSPVCAARLAVKTPNLSRRRAL